MLAGRTVADSQRLQVALGKLRLASGHFQGTLLAVDPHRVLSHGKTIVVTYYNAPNADQLRRHYERLPHKLQPDNISPNIPWLYGYKLDFRFR